MYVEINQLFSAATEEEAKEIREKLLYIGESDIVNELFDAFKTKTIDVLDEFILWSIVCIIEELALPSHTKQIKELLFSDRISFEKDRSYRCHLLDTLAKIGDSSLVPTLKEYGERIKEIEYSLILEPEPDSEASKKAWDIFAPRPTLPPDKLKKIDQEHIQRVIEAVCC
jgi:hypothetical protein